MTDATSGSRTATPAASGAAPGPQASGGRGWWTLLRNTYREIGADHIGLIAAGIGFYGLLAIFPALVAVMAIAGLVMDPAFVVTQLEGLARVLPQEAATIIIDQAVAVTGSQSGGLGLAAILGLLIALYSASKGVTSLIEGLNVAFEVEERRGYVRYYLVVFALTLGVIVGFLLVAALLAVLPAVLAVVGGGFGEMLAAWLRWPVVAGVVILGLAVLYKYAPSRGDVPWRWVTPGAVAATVLWLVGSALFTVYVANFGSYNETFGALGGVIVLLTWLWLSAYIVLMGAELDSEIERQDKLPGSTTTPGETIAANTSFGDAAQGRTSARTTPTKPPHERTIAEMVAAARSQH